MVASPANGFAQINYEPAAAKCSQSPYAFRPMYASSSELGRGAPQLCRAKRQ
jgi:hypothetical protein